MKGTARDERWGWIDIAALAVAIWGWGGNFLAIRFAVLEIPSWTALAIRLCIAGLVLAPFLRLPRGQWKPLLLITVVLVPGHFGMLFLASELTTNVSVISLLTQLHPGFTLLFAWLMLGEKPGYRRVLGLVLAMLGMLVLFYDPNLLSAGSAMWVITIAAAFLGLYSVLLRAVGSELRPVDIIGWTALLGAPMVGLVAAVFEADQWGQLAEVSKTAWLSLLYAVVMGSLFGHIVWAWLCQRHPVGQVAPFSLLVPVVAVLLSVLLLDEELSWRMGISAAVLCSGLYLIAKR